MGRHAPTARRAAAGCAVVLRRSGATLVELVVAMTLALVLLGAASATLGRQPRDAAAATRRSGAESQLRAALELIPSALQGLKPAAGDLVAGEARDTALQVRAVVAHGVACDSTAGQVILSAADSGAERETAVTTSVHVGDTLWWWPATGVAWTARRVTSVVSSTGVCAREGPASRPLLRLGFPAPDTVPRAAPIRLTRQTRFSFYHAGDGSWQLGIAEWSEVLHGFAPPQPVAGPFLLAGPAGGRSGFRYFDAAGTELPAGPQGALASAIARLRVTLIAPAGAPATPALVLRDSADVSFGHAP